MTIAIKTPDPSEPIKIFLETFGCQMNILDSELLVLQLKKAGHTFVDHPDQANVVLLNTCSVRDLSEQKVLSRLGIIKERKDRGERVVVGVLGCMAERAHTDLVKDRPFIDFLVGPSKLKDTVQLLEETISHRPRKTLTSLSNFRIRNKRSDSLSVSAMDDLEMLDRERVALVHTHKAQAYVRITRGCNKFCSFCVVPRTRGPEAHRLPSSIIDEVKSLVDQGVLEITLLGQTINHYESLEQGKQVSFADLLYRVHEEVPDLRRLRFLTSYPRDFSNEALEVMAASSRICKYLHIPAQSGSNIVLKRMNRGYRVEDYLSLIERAKEKMPTISFVGDMIVGFPGETNEDFLRSLRLLEQVEYKNVFVFKYSPRPQTVAQERYADDVLDEVKKERNNTMLKLQNQISLKHHQKRVGSVVSILVEGKAKLDPTKEGSEGLIQVRRKAAADLMLMGRTDGDHIVHFEGPENVVGQIVQVRVEAARPLSMSGTWIGV